MRGLISQRRVIALLSGVLLQATVLGACVTAAPKTAERVDILRFLSAEQTRCTETNPHPIAQSIANKYEVSYEQVMDWFCDGASFEDILLALETHELIEIPVEELLARAEQTGWDLLWEEVGLTQELQPSVGNDEDI